MVLTCSKCSRSNPPEAVYCYFDGIALGRSQNSGPVAVGAKAFHTPFVFPSGRACRNFDELALACQEEWSAAREHLARGHFEPFLTGIGRLDLARAAREAARFPDRDRGLDQMLAQFPSVVLEPPRLRLQPIEVNLGVLQPGASRQFDLHLENQGMRLLHGTISSPDAVWLALGADGAAEKHFQFNHETRLPVRVRGDRLRASRRPLEARLVVESNGGSAEVVVRASVPVTPYPDGVLAGCRSPRQLAEKARADPRPVAEQFENGAVARWYQTNGWAYPVAIPAASGLAAVQQFFEAHGFAKAPKVEISERAVALTGQAGTTLKHTLTVASRERRPVYAHAVSDAPWLAVGKARLHGAAAAIPLEFVVPQRPGETLSTHLVVLSNGNQRFVVPVTLTVAAADFDFQRPAPVKTAAVKKSHVEIEIPVAATAVRSARTARFLNWWHAAPAVLLLLALAGVLAADFSRPARQSGQAADAGGFGYPFPEPADAEPRLMFKFNTTNLRFGLLLPRERDPNDATALKRLTFSESGDSNNTCVKIDDFEYLLGRKGQGRLVEIAHAKERRAWLAEWVYPTDDGSDGVHVTQILQIVPGAQSGLLDTGLVRYLIENRGTTAHKVGLRVMLDTYIGGNDGVPFALPGKKRGLLTKPETFAEKDIPDYVEALEYPDLANPGTVATLGLKGFDFPDAAPEPVVKMIIGWWPGQDARWDWDQQALIRDGQDRPDHKMDSSVALYWDYRRMTPHEPARHLAFSYGLNTISAPEGDGGPLRLTTGGSFQAGNEFTVAVYVKNPRPGQKVKLILPPDGLRLADGVGDEQEVASAVGDFTQVSWKVRSEKEGRYVLAATSGAARASYEVRITSRRMAR